MRCDRRAAHFRDSNIRPGRKHVTELADNDIKLAIGEWKTFGVSLKPLRGSQPGYSRILARNVEQSRRQVESRHRCARPRCRDRNDSCAGSNVEYRLAGFDFRELDEMRRDRCGESSGRRKTTPTFRAGAPLDLRMDRRSMTWRLSTG